jgi:hypothetical protein
MAALVLMSACGREAKQAVSSAKPAFANAFTGDPESAYCRAALGNAVADLAPRDGSVAAETKYWNDYAAFLEQGEKVAPAEIKSAFHFYADNGLNKVMPVLRKYNFDEKRFMSEATPAEKKVMDEDSAPPGFEKAFERILRYEWQVCGSGTPDAATNVKYTGNKNSAFCKGEAEGQKAFGKIVDGGFDPAALKAFFTSEKFTSGMEKKLRVAPAAIKADAAADVNWVKTKQVPAMAKWDYDFKRIKLEAPAADRFAIDMSAVEIRDAEGRLNAYDSQVCGL